MLFNDSKKSIPAAMALLSAGLLLVSCGILWQRVFAPLLPLWTGPNDFFYGFSIGLGLTLEVVAAVLLVRINAERRAASASGRAKQ